MYWNVQIIQCVLFHLYFVNSFTDRSIVNGFYWTTLRKCNGFYIGKKYSDHEKFSDMSVHAWVTTCKNVIKDLRNNDAYVDAYVDYNMFLKYSGTRCKKLLVWVPKLSGNVEQDACICFYHLSILPLDIPHEYVQYNQIIMIYPLNITTLMVFEENKGQGNYYPLEIYENKRWSAYLSANVQIFTIVLPQGYGEASNLEIILDPMVQDLELISQKISNIVNQSNKNHFPQLCRIVFRRARYIEEFSLTPKGYIPKNQVSVVVVLGIGDRKPKLTFMSAFICRGYIPNSTIITTNYKLAAGPNESSAIVLKETDCPSEASHLESDFPIFGRKCHEIVELIENLSVQYINICF